MFKGRKQFKNKSKKIDKRIFFKFWFWLRSLSFIKHIFIFYLFITLIGSLLLWGNFSHNGTSVGYADSLFTAASAFSDTGLSPKVIATDFSMFGQTIIAILILVGGIGWFALKVYFFNILFGKRMSFATRDALSAERGSANVGVTRGLIKVAVTILFVIIVIASIVLTLYFYYVPVQEADRYTVLHNKQVISNFGSNVSKYDLFIKGSDGNFIQDANGNLVINQLKLSKIETTQSFYVPTGNWDVSIRYGIFHSISAINNAGFDIIGGQSVAGYYRSYGLQFIFIVLFVLGGVGYPVIYDTWKKITGLFTKNKHKYSLFSKVSMSAYIAITLIGLVVVFSIELTANNTEKIPLDTSQSKEIYHSFWNDYDYGTKGDKAMALFFNTMSTRNAGFSTINIGTLSRGTMIMYTVLMFIGSAPSSTAGGIRTTTLAVIVLGLWSRVRGKSTVRAFNRRIPSETVKNSYIVFTTALMILIVATLITMTSLSTHGGELNSITGLPGNWHSTINDVTGENYNFTEITFEVGSAFGTTGLSAGITAHLSLASELILILVMFIGQLGVSSSILVWSRKNPKSRHYEYIKQDIPIG